MDNFDRDNELRLIFEEYKEFFNPHWHLKISSADSLINNLNDDILNKSLKKYQSHIVVTTKENNPLRISVDNQGWFCIGTNNESFETFEMLMMNTSPLFQRQFGDKLSEKLNQIQN